MRLLIWLKWPSVSPHVAPHEAVNRLHKSTCKVKYEEVIKYVTSMFILRKKMLMLHLLPRQNLPSASFARQHVCPSTTSTECNLRQQSYTVVNTASNWTNWLYLPGLLTIVQFCSTETYYRNSFYSYFTPCTKSIISGLHCYPKCVTPTANWC